MKWRNFVIETLEDINALYDLPVEELEKLLEELRLDKQKETEEGRVMELSNLEILFMIAIAKKNEPSKEEREKLVDEMYLPEYRKDGYFNSAEFKAIEKEVEEEIAGMSGVTYRTHEQVKQRILKRKYNIDWRPLEEQFMPHVQVIID